MGAGLERITIPGIWLFFCVHSKNRLLLDILQVLFGMKKIVFFFIIQLFFAVAPAQPVYTLTNQDTAHIDAFGVLPDSGYTLNRVMTDTTLRFVTTDSLWPGRNGIYWIKLLIDNPSHYGGKYILVQQPAFNNTVFYNDQDTQKWQETSSGWLVQRNVRYFGAADCIIQGGARNTIYVRMDITALGKSPYFAHTWFLLEKETPRHQREQFSLILGIATILVVLMFLVYNAVAYSNIRDRTYWYYMLVQLGGILYVAGNFKFFCYLIPWQQFTVWLSPRGSTYYYYTNMFIQRMGTVIVISSYVQLTRHYLQTRLHLPRLDAVLKWATALWIVFELVHNSISFSGWKYMDYYTTLYSNLSVLTLIVLILITAIAARRRRIYAARYFLWANIASLLFMLALAVFYIFMPAGTLNMWLPCIAIIMQALMFSMALVARQRLVKAQLADAKTEAAQLKADIEQLEQQQQQLSAEHQQIEAAMQHEKSRNEVLEDKLAANNRQLASATLYIVQKNELLTQLKTNIKTLGKKLPHGSKDLDSIESNLQSNQFLDNDWEKFRLHFEQVHPRFFEELKAKYPNLTQNETRLCAYFHMNLGTKEIAGLLNIDPASVRRAKTRLNKKMNGALMGNGE